MDIQGNKCIFRTRLIKQMKEKKMSCTALATRMNVTTDTIKKYRRNDNGNIPVLDTVKKLADILDVDTAYLLGEIECKRIYAQKIQDLTGLSVEASEKLLQLTDKKYIYIDILNNILTNENIENLLLSIWEYSNCHNKEIIVVDSTDKNDNEKIYNESKRKSVFKFTASEYFGKMLDEFYDNNIPLYNYRTVNSIIQEMIENIAEHKPLAEDDDRAMDLLVKIVDTYLDKIKDLDKEAKILQFPAKYIIENVDLFMRIFKQSS